MQSHFGRWWQCAIQAGVVAGLHRAMMIERESPSPDSQARSPVPFATVWHGILLVMGSWCTVLAPVLPRMKAHFAATPHVDLMIGFVATMPSLAVALLAIPIGRLADRVGLAKVLLIGLLCYAVAGVAPFWMQSIHAIIAARFLVGLGEGAVMITSTALIGVAFSGPARARWLATQVASSNFLAIGVLFIGGMAGMVSWQAPFLVYSFALVLFVPCAIFLPRLGRMDGAHVRPATRTPWPQPLKRLVFESCALIFLSTIGMFVIVIQSSFLFAERGAADSAHIGLGMAFAATGVALGATAAGMLERVAVTARLIAALLVMGIGFVAMALVDGFGWTSLTGAIAGFGCGFIIPTLLSRLLGQTPPEAMGAVSGAWLAATFIGQFANPPLFVLLRSVVQTQSAAIATFALVPLGLAVLLMWRAFMRRLPTNDAQPNATP